MSDEIILVDLFDVETGSAEKMDAHRQKKLHQPKNRLRLPRRQKPLPPKKNRLRKKQLLKKRQKNRPPKKLLLLKNPKNRRLKKKNLQKNRRKKKQNKKEKPEPHRFGFFMPFCRNPLFPLQMGQIFPIKELKSI